MMNSMRFTMCCAALAFVSTALFAQDAVSVNGFELSWKNDGGFSVKQGDEVISCSSQFLCVEPPWKSHWFYAAKHAPIVTSSANALTVASDPKNPSPFFLDTYSVTVLSATKYQMLVRGRLTQDVPAFVEHVVASIPENLVNGAEVEFDGRSVNAAEFFANGKTVSPPFSVCVIHAPSCDITMRVLKGPKYVLSDYREIRYLGKKAFILIAPNRITVKKDEMFEQEFEFTVIPKEKGALKKAAAPSPDAAARPAALKTSGFFGPPDDTKALADIVREESAYNGVFSWDDYRKLLKELSKPQYLILPLGKFQNDTTTGKVIIGMRHDIDSHPEKALVMAKIEKDMGLSSTYFFLHSAKYYGAVKNGVMARNGAIDTLAKQLYEQGFEVGIHTDLFTMMWEHQFDPVGFLKEEMAYYRQLGIPVNGAAAHGNMNVIGKGLNNMYMFSDFGVSGTVVVNGIRYAYGKNSIADYGLAYEAYKIKCDGSTSDIGGKFDGRTLDEIIQYFGTLKPGTRFILLTHPEHWGSS